MCDSKSEVNFPHQLLFTDTQVARILKAFANVLSANVKFLKTPLSKVLQVRGFLGRRHLGLLLKVGLPLMCLNHWSKLS